MVNNIVGTKKEPMLFTGPCCKVLKHCLDSPGEDRAFQREGDKGALFIRTMSSLYDSSGRLEKQFHQQAVIFCPFCGKRLQTAEDVERYVRGDPI
jgi:hypothetical protein